MRRWLAIILAVLILAGSGGWWLYFSPSSPYWHGEYIPKDLDDAHAELLREMPAAEIERIKGFSSEDQMIEYHMGAGMGMRNGWGLWGGSRLALYFNKLGIFHPDDMSGILLDTFWCRLHQQPFRLDERVAFYQLYWKEAADPPATSLSPQGKPIFWAQSWRRGTKTDPREIHVGIAEDHSFWAYEYDKGVYAPSPEMLDEIKRDEYWKTSADFIDERRKQLSSRPSK